MANLLQSSQTQATQAPSYYTDYLSNIATKGAAQVDPLTGAQYVGSQPLQEAAFANVQGAAGAFKPTLTAAENVLISARDSTSPLSAAETYLESAGTNPATAATGYMSPYTTGVVNQIGNLGQRNIMQNLAPQATAGAVGSGQFGSKRGAEVLGQTVQNASRDILGQQASAMEKGYQSALDAALKQNQLQAQMGQTAGTLASQGTQNLTNLGNVAGQLASTNQALNLADINALATLGEQQRTLKQNEQLFPLSNLSTLSGMLRGYNVPTTTKTTAEMSPLSALAGIGTGAVGLFSGTGTGGTGPSLFDNIKKSLGTGAFTGTVFDPLQGEGLTYGSGDTGFQNQLDDIYGTNQQVTFPASNVED
jgi:hypothetical protein